MTSLIINNEKILNTVALVGNPNSGKSTVFNGLTRMKQKVGNYSGVTIEKKIGQTVLPGGKVINVLDLPGTYSLAVRSPDEQVVKDVLMGTMDDTPDPDAVICVVDASNLERHLYLVSQVQDLGLPVIVALNMMDELPKLGRALDIPRLEQELGSPVVSMVASNGEGIEALKEVLAAGVEPKSARSWRMPELLEQECQALTRCYEQSDHLTPAQAFSEALIALTNDTDGVHGEAAPCGAQIRAARGRLTAAGIPWQASAIESRYNWIHDFLIQVTTEQQVLPRRSDRIDAVLTHKVWGWAFFVAVMSLMFYAIFTVATYPMAWIDSVFQALAQSVKALLPAGVFTDLLSEGVIPGVGGVAIFLPQILTLFFFISLLQDTGYMARAAFIMDRLMSRVGLHGKSFIPLLSSFACTIPGVLATRSIENVKDRLVTIMVAPLMICSARLPVFTMMIAVLIPNTRAWQKVTILLALYALGIIGAVIAAWLLKRSVFKGPTPPFIMELPPYRKPSLKAILWHMWERSRLFLKKAGTVILLFSILLWIIMSYPKTEGMPAAMALKESYGGQLGQVIEPVIRPLGYDWRIGIGLIGSFAAREIFVSTMSIVFHLDGHTDTATLREAFTSAQWPDGRPLFTPLVCVSLLIFYVFAMQCVSSLVMIRRETGSWKWPVFQLVTMTGTAYILALAVYQGGRWLGWQ